MLFALVLPAVLGGSKLLFLRRRSFVVAVVVGAAAALAAAVGSCLSVGAIVACSPGVLYCGLRSATVRPDFAASAVSVAASLARWIAGVGIP